MYEINGSFYDWDEDKYRINLIKHGIDFREAATIFDDPNALYDYDPDHSEFEERFIALGMSENDNLLTVCHCYRSDDTVTRIISARKAHIFEQRRYGGMFI